jgi:AAA+ superfamily predicted ATPase
MDTGIINDVAKEVVKEGPFKYPEGTFEYEVDLRMRSRLPIIWIISVETNRVNMAIANIAYNRNKSIHFWTPTTGVDYKDGIKTEWKMPIDETPYDPSDITKKKFIDAKPIVQAMPTEAFTEIKKMTDGGQEGIIFYTQHITNFVESNNPQFYTRMRDCYQSMLGIKNTLIVVTATRPKIPEGLAQEIFLIDFKLPDAKTRKEHVGEMFLAYEKMNEKLIEAKKPNLTICYKKKDIINVAESLGGLTMQEMGFCMRYIINKLGSIDSELADHVLLEKIKFIKKTGLLNFPRMDVCFEDVGGLEVLKKYLLRRKKAYTDKARKYGLPKPKGVLIIGIQGCGKSHIAKATAKEYGFPLVQFDIGSMKGGVVGETEGNLRQVMGRIESLSSSLVWIDELDKAFGGLGSEKDGNTMMNVFGTFINWLQEGCQDTKSFKMATANNYESLPAELVRKGRFDETFFVDLPHLNERKMIWEVHIAKPTLDDDGTPLDNGRDPANFDIDRLAKLSKNFSGAEIEQCWIEGKNIAYDNDREVETEDAVSALKDTVPMSKTQKEKIDALRKSIKGRARNASLPDEEMEERNTFPGIERIGEN